MEKLKSKKQLQGQAIADFNTEFLQTSRILALSMEEEELVRIYLKGINGCLRRNIGLLENMSLSVIMTKAVKWERQLKMC